MKTHGNGVLTETGSEADLLWPAPEMQGQKNGVTPCEKNGVTP